MCGKTVLGSCEDPVDEHNLPGIFLDVLIPNRLPKEVVASFPLPPRNSVCNGRPHGHGEGGELSTLGAASPP